MIKEFVVAVDFIAHPMRALRGDVRVPGDKSISHRAVMLASLANGTTRVSGFLSGADAIATMMAFRAMGVKIDHQADQLIIHGVGMHGLRAPQQIIDLGNSGTAMRLMMGLLAGQKFDAELTGDASLRSRPMTRISDPLAKMGASIVTQKGRAPLKVENTHRVGQGLNAISYALPMASAQVKSAVLLAGLYAEGQTCVTEPAVTRDHTERMLRGFGYPVETANGQICLQGGGELKAADIDVPADISSAAFLMVAAAISQDSDIRLRHVGINPTRIGIIHILEQMGARIDFENKHEVGGEPVADILMGGSELTGIDIPLEWVPLAIDEIPVLAIAAACAKGVTRLSGAEELRVKESDRISAIVNALQVLGVKVHETPDGFVIHGKGGHARTESIFTGGMVQSVDDHRIAMAMAVASLRASDTITIKECDNVATSFPDFVGLVNDLGLRIEQIHQTKAHA